MPENTTVSALIAELASFADERDWDQYHIPKNLSMALMVESAELLEIFQWLTPEQSRNLSNEQFAAVDEEIADILIYLLRLSDKLDIDPIDAAVRKIAKNRDKYPADKVRGQAKKYTEYT